MPTPVEALRSPDAAAGAVAVLDPSGDGLDAVLALGAQRMSDTGLVDALVACERLLAAVAGKQQEFLAEIARRDPDGELFLRDEVACALKLAPATAGQKLDAAVELTGRLADTGELLSAGYLSYANARTLASAVEDLEDDVAAKVQDRVLPRGCDQTPGEFKAAVRRAVARFDRKDEAQRHADAIVDICSAALAMPGLPHQHGIKPAISVTIAETTLTGLDDQPADLDGYGPIPAAMARSLATLPGATQHRYVVDASGRVVDHSETISGNYQPSVRLARHVVTRDQHCIHPGCRRRAWACELDHRTSWPDGPPAPDDQAPPF